MGAHGLSLSIRRNFPLQGAPACPLLAALSLKSHYGTQAPVQTEQTRIPYFSHVLRRGQRCNRTLSHFVCCETIALHA
jgi:hypothetical protein